MTRRRMPVWLRTAMVTNGPHGMSKDHAGLLCSCRMARMLESPSLPAGQQTNRANAGVKLGVWLVENRRDAEAVPVLEKALPAARRLGLHGMQWDAELALLEALYALKQRDKLFETLKTVVQGYEKRAREGSCSERDLAELKSALGACIGAEVNMWRDPDPGVVLQFLRLGEEALEGGSGTVEDRVLWMDPVVLGGADAGLLLFLPQFWPAIGMITRASACT
jgi:hypothetical protein